MYHALCKCELVFARLQVQASLPPSEICCFGLGTVVDKTTSLERCDGLDLWLERVATEATQGGP